MSSSSSSVLKLTFTIVLLLSLQTSINKNSPQALHTEPECEARLLPLLPCMTFVQGLVHLPPQLCCDNLAEVYDHHPTCLCSLLNQSTTSSFPINRTLALRLPPLCNVSANGSRCTAAVAVESPSPKVPPPGMGNGGIITNSSSTRPLDQTTSMPDRGFFLPMRSGGNRREGLAAFALFLAISVSYIHIYIL